MTREQAINYLISSGFSEEQVSEVVRALTYEPTTKNDLGVDCIDRAQAQTEIEMNALRYTLAKERGGMGKVEWSDNLISIDDALDIIRKLPSVTPQPCEDAVSRQEVLDLIADYDLSMGQVVRGIHALPSVTPQEPRWIPVGERLPEAEYGESDSVLVCFENETQDVLYFDGSNWRYPTGETYISVNHKNDWHNKVVAWMPLPKPYREVDE